MPSAAHEVAVQLNRSRLLDILYDLEGRDNPEDPYCGCYTGLFQDFCRDVGRQIVYEALEDAFEMDALLSSVNEELNGQA